MKVVINTNHWGFCLSEEACKYLGCNKYFSIEEGVSEYYDYEFYEDHRSNPKLVECVESLGSKANGMHARLEVVEIPDDVEWYISSEDGVEWVAEKHRIWVGKHTAD